ncbi:MAG: translocation/assembly module TamB domain-containing protein [Thiohalocapsa sp.]|nr:translocation/assembly module TamB domain-containing protein [Thiohalocapsa sp.]
MTTPRRHGRRRPSALRRALTALALLPWTAAALLLALVLGADTDAGRALIARALSAAGGGQVLVQGLGGELPFSPRIDRLELSDAEGVWLRAEDVAIVLRPASLLRGELDFRALTAHRLAVKRLPETDAENRAPARLPLSIHLRRLVIAQLRLEALEPSAPAFVVTGTGRIGGARTDAELMLSVPGRSDRYRLAVGPGAQGHRVDVALHEAKDGPLAGLARKWGVPLPPELADWTLSAQAQGSASAAAVSAELAAGPVRVGASGVLDLSGGMISALETSVEVAATGAALPGARGVLDWERITARAEMTGPLRAPRGTVRMNIDRLALSRAAAPASHAGADGLPGPGGGPGGERGGFGDAASRRGLEAPPGVASGPPAFPAGDVRLEGSFDLARGPRVDMTLAAASARVPEPWGMLLGPEPRLRFSAERDGPSWRIDEARLDSDSLDVELAGRIEAGALDLTWALDAQAPAAPGGWSGTQAGTRTGAGAGTRAGAGSGALLHAEGRLDGTPQAPRIDGRLAISGAPAAAKAADGTGGTDGGRVAQAPPGQVDGRLQLEPLAPRGRLALQGRWLGQPVTVDVSVDPLPGGGLDLRLGDSRWADIALSGRLRRAGDARLPSGDLQLRIARLDDAAALLMPLLAPRLPDGLGASPERFVGGRLDLRAELDGERRIGLFADVAALRLAAVRVGALSLGAEVLEPLGRVRTDAQLQLTEIEAAGWTGAADVRARGPLDACDLDVTAELGRDGSGGDVRLAAAGRLEAGARRLTLQRLTADARDRRLRLLAPAGIDLGDGVAVDSLRLGLSTHSDAGAATAAGELDVGGRIVPRLELEARIADLSLAAIAPWLPGPPAGIGGVLDARASLAGSLAAPTGRVSADARAVVLPAAAGGGLPAASARLALTLEPAATLVDAEAWLEGRARLALDGRVGGPLQSASAPLELRGRGHFDLSLLDPWLAASGRRADGRATLDVQIAGARGAPRVNGRLDIEDGDWRDRRLGLWLDDIAGSVRLDGDRLRIERLGATAGTGALTLDGSLGWLAPGRPVDLRLRARGAEPIRLDLLQVRGDADLTLQGAIAEDVRLAGEMRFDRVDIRVPEQLPPDIPTLDVTERGERRQPRPAQPAALARGWRSRLDLDVRIQAPRAIRVRGRNIDAELGGRVRLGGNADAPFADGSFALLRGEYDLIGQPLRFTRGRLGFDGADLLDPTLELEARARSPGGTAILAVEGRARAPRVVLRGEPPMSDDEVLSRLLFGVAPGRLSAFQLTRIGLAATSLAGLGADGGGLLDRVRTGLRLDGLRIDSDRDGNAVFEGGRNITERVYLGARQGAAGDDPRGVLRLDLAPQIRLESDVGGGGARAGAAFELDY